MYDADGSHPSKLGTLLTAYIFVAAIVKETPANLPRVYSTTDFEGENVILMIMNPEDEVFCKKIAKEIIKSKP